MKLHLPNSLRKALLAILTTFTVISHSASANNSLINHGQVGAGIGFNGVASDSAYGWADGLNFTAGSSSICHLGEYTDFSHFDESQLIVPVAPIEPIRPIEPVKPSIAYDINNPVSVAAWNSYNAAYGEFTAAMTQYTSAKNAYDAAFSVYQNKCAALNNLTESLKDLTNSVKDGTYVSGSAYVSSSDVTYDSGKIYENIISSAYIPGNYSTLETSGEVTISGPGVNTTVITSAVSHGHIDTAASGYININGSSVMFSNSCVADSYLNITNGGSLNAPLGAGSVSINGQITVNNGSSLSAGNIHSNQQIVINNNSSVSASVITAENGIICDNSTLKAQSTDLTIDTSLSANNSQIFANQGKLILQNLEGNNNTLSAEKLIDITSGIVGNDNSFDTEKGSIHFGANNGVSIDGDGNRLGMGGISTENIILDGSISGDSNKLNAANSIVTGAITGDNNDLTVSGSRNNSNTEVIKINGDIVGNNNTLLVENNGSIKINGNIGDGTVDGSIGNSIIAQNDGSISITGQVSGTNETIKTLGQGNINLGSFGANNGLNLLVSNGNLTVANGSHAVIGDQSVIKVSGDAVLGSDLTVPAPDLVLVIDGGSSFIVGGNLTANQSIQANGVGSSIAVANGDISVLGTLTASENATITGMTITAGSLLVTNGAVVTATENQIVLNNGNFVVSGGTVNGNVSGVEAGMLGSSTALSTVNGTITGTGVGSLLDIIGSVNVGTPSIDGTISNFQQIMIGNAVEDTILNVFGSLTTSLEGLINIVNAGVDVTGDMIADAYIEILNASQVVIGGNQEASNGHILIDESSLTVLGNQTAGDFIQMTNGADVSIGGDQTAGTSVFILNSTLTVTGDQIAQTGSIDIYNTNVTIGGNQTAKTDIVLGNKANVTIDGNQEASEGFIGIDDSIVTILGNQMAGNFIQIENGADVSIGGNQTSGADIFIISGSNVSIGGDQTAEGNIIVGDSTLAITGDQISQNSLINIENSVVTIGGNQTAKETISLGNKANVTIDGNQEATEGFIAVYDSSLTVLGNQTAGEFIQITSGSDVSIGGDQVAGIYVFIQNSALSITGDQIAQNSHINIENSVVTIGGNQTAKETIVLGNKANVTIDGNQEATEGSINVYDSSLTVLGNQTAGELIQITNGSDVSIGGNQTAGTNIVVQDSTLDVAGDQIAQNGFISIDNSDVTIGGDQTAKTNIGLNNKADVTIDGNQEATDGWIDIQDSSLTVLGNQSAGSGINIDNGSNVSIGGNQTAGDYIQIINGSDVTIGGDQTAGTRIVIKDSTLAVTGDQVALTDYIGVENSMVTVGGNQTASANIRITNGSDVSIGGNQTAGTLISVIDSTLAVTGDQVALTDYIEIGNSIVTIGGDQTAKTNILLANKANVTIDGNQEAIDGWIDIDDSSLTVLGNQTAGNNITITNGSDISIGGNQMAGDYIHIRYGCNVSIGGNQTGTGYILVDRSQLVIDGNMEVLDPVNSTLSGVIQVLGDSTVNVGGSVCTSVEGIVFVGRGAILSVAQQLISEQGSLILLGKGTQVDINVSNDGDFSTVISSGIGAVQVAFETVLNTGNVVVEGTMTILEGMINATAWETINGNTIVNGLQGEGRFTITEGDLVLSGTTQVRDGAMLLNNAGDINLSDSIWIENSAVITETGHISVVSNGEGVVIDSSAILAESSISLIGAEENRINVVGTSEIISRGTQDYALTDGSVSQAGIILDNVNIFDMSGDRDVTAMVGDIVINNVVQVTDATLYTNSGDIVNNDGIVGTVLLNGDAMLIMDKGSALESTLSSVDTSAELVKLGGDTLSLNYSALDYKGSIYVLENDGSDLVINSAGVNHESVTYLADTNYTVTAKAFDDAVDGIVSIGSLNTTLDEGLRNGLDNQVLINGSYTYDDGNRVGYQEMGTIISFNAGNIGDVVKAKDLVLTSNTLVRMEGVLNGDGSVAFDQIKMDGTLHAGGARLFGTLLAGNENEANIADQTRAQIVAFEGAVNIISSFNEDMLYDVVLDGVSGTYQRVLQTLNAWVETTSEGVFATYSKNHVGASKTANQAATSLVLLSFAQKVDHTEGTLGSSSSKMDQLLDALDYTRSEQDALRALDSISGASNTLAQLSMMDGNRHHVDTLRSYISMPNCDTAGKQDCSLKVDGNSSVWLAYTGGYDRLEGDRYMGNYTRSFQGALLGYQRTINCNLLVGLDFGYEHSISRTDETKFDSDTYFIDIFAAARTGRFDHRLSAGVGIYDFDAKRTVRVNAAGHSFNEDARGNMNATAINVGYELSTSFELSRTSCLLPFFTIQYSYNSLNDLTETGMDTAGLKTKYDNFSQVDLGLGARYQKSLAIVKNQNPAVFHASASLRAELSDRQPTVTNSFLADEDVSYRIKSLKRSPMFLQIGSGLAVPFAKGWMGNISAIGEFGDGRTGVNGSIGVSHSF